MKGRRLVAVTATFLAGNALGGLLTFPPLLYLALAAAFALTALLTRRTAAVAAALLMLGAAGVQTGRMPGGNDGTTALKAGAALLKQEASDRIGALIPEGDERAILKALTVGDRSEVSRELKNDFKASGAMHLLALSGLHVGILYKIISLMLFFIGGSRAMQRIRSLFTLALLWCFAVVTGLGPSISRAALMITIHEISGAINTERDGLTSLSAAALAITLFNPEAPRSVSFQLSFCACLALFTLYPRLKGLLSTRSRLLTWCWNCMAVAISCQLFTGPLSLLNFGTFPIFFMVTNLLTVPLTGAIMYLVVVAVITSPIPHAGELSATLLYKALQLLNTVVEIIGDI